MKIKNMVAVLMVLALFVSGMPAAFATEGEGEGNPAETAVQESAETPSPEPTAVPTQAPTTAPTQEPAAIPTQEPTAAPTQEPSDPPAQEPTVAPTQEPTVLPDEDATVAPTQEATVPPAQEPTVPPAQEPSVAPTQEAAPTPSLEPTATPESVDYNLPVAKNPAFRSGFGEILTKSWVYADDHLSSCLLLVPSGGIVYVDSRLNPNTANDFLYIAVYTQEGAKEGYIKSAFVRPLSPDQTQAHLANAKKSKDAYAYGNDQGRLLTKISCSFASNEAKTTPTAAPAPTPAAQPAETIETNEFALSYTPGGALDPLEYKAALGITSYYTNKTNPIVGEWITFRVNFSGGAGPYYIKNDLYINNKLAQTTGYYAAASYTTDAARVCCKTPATYHMVVSVKDGKGKVVTKLSPFVYAANKLSVVKCQPDLKNAAPGSKITFTAVFNGGEKPYQYQMSLYKGNYQLNTGSWKTGQQYVFIPQGTGPYRVKVTVKDARGRTMTTFSSYSVIGLNVKYRALLIGQTYAGTPNELHATLNDRNAVGSVLSSMGATPYAVTKKADLSAGGIISAINGVFGAATENDVSLLYYSGHGLYSYDTTYLGALCGTDNGFVTPTKLRNTLDKIPGKKIVIIDACHSGNMIGKTILGARLTEKAINEKITNSFISAFSSASKSNLATGNYYVLVAAHSTQTSVEVSTSGGKNVGIFTYYFCGGAGYNELTQSYLSSLPADGNGDGSITLSEMYSFVRSNVGSGGFTQEAQVYPSGSSFVLFGKK